MNRDVTDELDFEPRSGGHGAGIAGAIALAGLVGLGIGLLAAPQSGERTREQLRKRLSALGEDIEDGLEEFEERSRPARKELRRQAERLKDRGGKAVEALEERLEERLERLEGRDEDHGGGIISLVTFAAGIAASYFLTSERAAPTRAKVREAAGDIRRRATDRWDRFQERRHSNGGASERASQPESPSGGLDA